MMYFLQDTNESNALQIEIEELKIALDEYGEKQPNFAHKYKVVTSDFFKNYNDTWYSREWMRDYAIPVGSIEFVHNYLKAFHDIEKMNPIEVPQCLRLQHLLLRDYKIVPYEQIPKDGCYFVKNVSRLKSWTYCGSMSGLFSEEFIQDDMDKNHIFQVSTPLNILSEYRVFVMGHEIIGIQFYDGDPTIMPNERDIKKIKEMVVRWTAEKDCPQAFTMDVAVVKSELNETKRDLALIECHPFCAAGTYGCRGAFLPMMFRRGIRWYIDHNAPIIPTE